MDVKFFDSLSRRDFDNGGILDDIRKALKEREQLLAEVERLRCYEKAEDGWIELVGELSDILGAGRGEGVDDAAKRVIAEVNRLKGMFGGPYPIQHGPSVPWWVMAPHDAQSQRNHGQSIKRIAERGGFSPVEAWCVIRGLYLGDAEKEVSWDAMSKFWRKFAARVNNPKETKDPETIGDEVVQSMEKEKVDV